LDSESPGNSKNGIIYSAFRYARAEKLNFFVKALDEKAMQFIQPIAALMQKN
jgi:hypothetical protein